jgi:hypothetical protein
VSGNGWRKWSLCLACLLVTASCAKHKLNPIGAAAPTVPASSLPATPVPQTQVAQAGVTGGPAKKPGPDVNQLLLEPPRMSFSRDMNKQPGSRHKVDKVTILVDAGTGNIPPEATGIVENALSTLSGQFLFLCPDRMRAGVTADCRFTTKEGTNDFFTALLIEQGVETSEAAAVTLLVAADLISPDKNAFDIRAVPDNLSTVGQVWHVLPANAGEHELELRLIPSARISSGEVVQGPPVILHRSVSVVGVDVFFNQYGPAIIGSVAALGLLTALAWMLWRNGRLSIFSSR